MTIKFTDGLEINTDGRYRVIGLWDGHYVVGHGLLIPVCNRDEGEELIEELKEQQNVYRK